jgi:hypothetical protein
MATTTNGKCNICGIELGKTAMKNHILKKHGNEDVEECCLLKIEGAYDKDYWLFIDIPVKRRLSDVDKFLRKIWLECCGHMSAFRTNERSRYNDIDQNSILNSFAVNDKIIHEYDFGSTTESLITVMGSTIRPPQKEVVRLLARNIAPQFQCCSCDNPAEYIDVERIYDSNNPFYCASCAEVDEYGDYNMLLPVTNSPRMGVCGYEGELDVFIENH